MNLSEEPAVAVAESDMARHLAEGKQGAEMQFAEWMREQCRACARATMEMVRPPRHMSTTDEPKGIPRIEDEELAYHLTQVCAYGIDGAPASMQFLSQHPEAHNILHDWLQHFGPLFNILCKQFGHPYEIAEIELHVYQMRLVENVQNLRRIFEWESHGEILRPSVAWGSLEWRKPTYVIEDGIWFLRQSVYLPHVVGEGAETELILDGVHSTRESLYTRLTPYG